MKEEYSKKMQDFMEKVYTLSRESEPKISFLIVGGIEVPGEEAGTAAVDGALYAAGGGHTGNTGHLGVLLLDFIRRNPELNQAVKDAIDVAAKSAAEQVAEALINVVGRRGETKH